MKMPDSKVQIPEKAKDNKPQTYKDLEDRFSSFGIETIKLCKIIKQDTISKPLINQIIRSSTSIGANYLEANNASSKKDFRNKIYIAKKEAEESKHWLKMLKVAAPERTDELRILWTEVHQIVLILQAIVNKVDDKH